MECHFDFTKKTISKIVGEFLIENFPNESEHIKRIMSGKKLPYMEANQVLRNIMTALTASNTHVTEEIVIGSQEEYHNIRDFVTLNKSVIKYLPRCKYHLL